jgi:hypothetical protein
VHGVGFPWAQARGITYLNDHVWRVGVFGDSKQPQKSVPKTAEGNLKEARQALFKNDKAKETDKKG